MMEVLYREPCPNCSKQGGDYKGDNLVRYEDGHGYCFACNSWYASADAEDNVYQEGTRKMSQGLVDKGSHVGLPKRRLTAQSLEKFDYSVGEVYGKTAHIATYRGQSGSIQAQHIRFQDKSFSWCGDSKQVQLFGQHLWKTNGKRLVITEGEIDAMTISQLQGHKWPVVSIPSGVNSAKKAITDNLEFVEGYTDVIICFDNDTPGQTAAKEVATVLSPGKAKICTLPLKDASDMLQADRGNELIECLWNARAFRPDGIVSAKDLLSDLLKEPPKGYQLPYPQLTEMLQGIRKGELTLFTAGSGIGKSTLIHEIGKHFIDEHDLRIGVMALEESKKRTLERYVSIELNKPIHTTSGREGVTEDELIKAFHAVTDTEKLWLYDHFGSTEIDNLMSKIKYMVKSLEIDFLILDHISIVVSGLSSDEGERKCIDILMTALRSLIEESGIGVLAIVHLKRPDKGKGYNEGRQVSLSDLRGSASLEQLSDVVIAIERDQQNVDDGDVSKLRVLKSRPVGILGEADNLLFNHETGRLQTTVVSYFNTEEGGTDNISPSHKNAFKGESDF